MSACTVVVGKAASWSMVRLRLLLTLPFTCRDHSGWAKATFKEPSRISAVVIVIRIVCGNLVFKCILLQLWSDPYLNMTYVIHLRLAQHFNKTKRSTPSAQPT